VRPAGVQRGTQASGDVGDLVKSKRFDEGFKAGAEAERKRIQSVEEMALPGHEDLIAKLKYDGHTTGAQAAMQVIAERKKRLAVKTRRRVESPKKQPFIVFRNTAAAGRKP
jgi:hypothetical protein